MSNAKQLHALLLDHEAKALHHADEEFGRLLQRYYQTTQAMRASEAGRAPHDDFTLYRLHRHHDDASQALLDFFENLEPGEE